MRFRDLGSIAVLVACPLVVSGCRSQDSFRGTTSGGSASPSSSDLASGSAIVATVGGVAIAARDVAAQMRGFEVDARRALDDLVVFALLARAAADAQITAEDRTDAEALDAIRVQRLIEREIEPHIDQNAIPETDVRALYERGKKRFVHGRMVQVAVLCVFTGARMRPEPRARAEESARELKAFIDRRATKTAADFDEIAKDPLWVDRQVSVTTVWQGEDEPFPAVVGRAALTLSKPGDTTNLVGDETGYYVARYISDRPAENVSFAAAAPGLRRDMFEPWRRQKFLHLSITMSADHAVQIFPENFPLLATEIPAR